MAVCARPGSLAPMVSRTRTVDHAPIIVYEKSTCNFDFSNTQEISQTFMHPLSLTVAKKKIDMS